MKDEIKVILYDESPTIKDFPFLYPSSFILYP